MLTSAADAAARGVVAVSMSQFPYAEAIVRETLRLYPPAVILNRMVKAGGFALTPDIVVPEGVGVFPFPYGYQRCPKYWPAAEEFRPERWLPEGKHLAPTTPDAWTPFGRWGLLAQTACCWRRRSGVGVSPSSCVFRGVIDLTNLGCTRGVMCGQWLTL